MQPLTIPSVLNGSYDWKGRYEVDFSDFRIWEEKLFSSDGWRVPAVMLGWTLSEEPILRRVLPESLKRWSVNASWSETNDYAPLLDDFILYLSILIGQYTPTKASMASRHRDLTTSLSFRSGGPDVALSASWSGTRELNWPELSVRTSVPSVTPSLLI